MSIVFYQASTPSSAVPVACALRELGVAHEAITLSLAAGDTRKPDYLRLNPNAKVPLLVVDGTPLFEGLAIVLWLAERFGVEKRVWPAASSLERGEALSWSVWAYASYGAMLGRHLLATSPTMGSEFHNSAQAAYTKKELDGMLGILDARLASRQYVLGDDFSMADLTLASSVSWGVFAGLAVSGFEHVDAWLKRCQARPSFRDTFAAFR